MWTHYDSTHRAWLLLLVLLFHIASVLLTAANWANHRKLQIVSTTYSLQWTSLIQNKKLKCIMTLLSMSCILLQKAFLKYKNKSNIWEWSKSLTLTKHKFLRSALCLFSFGLSIYLSIRSPESCCRMDGMYLSCHMGSLITPSPHYQTCRQTAVKQRIPLRILQTAQCSDNEPNLTSVHITAAISPVIIKLHRADRQIHINERSCALDLAELNVSTLILSTQHFQKVMLNMNINYFRCGEDSNICRVETIYETCFDLSHVQIKPDPLTFLWRESLCTDI